MIGELDAETGRQQVNADRMRELLVGERNAQTVEVLEGSLHEAIAAIDELRHQRELLDRRQAAIAPIADELPELRAERIASLAETPSGDEALELVARLAELDEEQRAVAHAITAGEAAQDPLIAIARVDAFSTGQRFNQGPGGHDFANELTWLSFNFDKHAGAATARLAAFRAALVSTGLPPIAALPTPDRHKIRYTSAGARPEYVELWGGLMDVISGLATRLTELRARRTNVDAAIATLEAERDRLLQPA